MGFLIFLWNMFVRLVTFFGFILIETAVFTVIYQALSTDHPILAFFLGVIFFIWILVEIILRIFVGTGVSVIKYIFGRFL